VSKFGRLLLHVPVGLANVGLYAAEPALGLGGTLAFLFYERNEDRWLKDQAWIDVAGFLWGLFLGGLVWVIL
jgi:hypothetical protein